MIRFSHISIAHFVIESFVICAENLVGGVVFMFAPIVLHMPKITQQMKEIQTSYAAQIVLQNVALVRFPILKLTFYINARDVKIKSAMIVNNSAQIANDKSIVTIVCLIVKTAAKQYVQAVNGNALSVKNLCAQRLAVHFHVKILKNIQKCQNCEGYFGMCNDCSVVHKEGIQNSFYECQVCMKKLCLNCKLDYKVCNDCGPEQNKNECEEKYKVKMPYIRYHKFLDQPWEEVMKLKLQNLCNYIDHKQTIHHDKEFLHYLSEEEFMRSWDGFKTYKSDLIEFLQNLSIDNITLTKIYAEKLLYNLSQKDASLPVYGDSLLPITSNCYDASKSQNIDFDIVFVQGDLKKAGVGKRPFIFVSYSMGGVVTRQIILQHPEISQNLKGVQFIGSPLVKSDLREQINDDMKGLIPICNHYMLDAIHNLEYISHFLKDGLALNIPYKILIEEKKTLLRLIGKDYFYVPFDCGVIEPHKQNTFRLMHGKSHGDVQQAIDKQDQTFIETKQFIDQCIGLNRQKEETKMEL
eukprot:403331334